MSRVNEALERTLGGASRISGPAPDTPRPLAGSMSIDQYPTEHSVPGRNGERPNEPARAADWAMHAMSPTPAGVTPTVDSTLAAQCRRLSAVMADAQAARGVRTVMITAALPGESKTRLALSLALTLSELSPHVLLIDADVRQPAVHARLGVSGQPGLTDLLRATRSELPLVEVSPTLAVLTAGPPEPNAAALLLSDRMRLLLDDCAARFDWVLLDAPSVATAADAHRLASRVQGVIVVIDAASPFSAVEQAIAQIGRSRILGTVLTGLNRTGAADA